METKRLLLLAGVLMAAVIALLWFLQSGFMEATREKEDLRKAIQTGDRGLRGTRRKAPRPVVERSGKASVCVLEVRLPEDDPRARAGGRAVLRLYGNNVVLWRPDPTRPLSSRAILGRQRADGLILEAMELPPARKEPAARIHLRLAAGEREIPIGEESLVRLLKAPSGKVSLEIPDKTSVSLKILPTPPEGAPRMPWPFFRPPPPEPPAGPLVLGAPRERMRRFLEAWTPSLVLVWKEGSRERFYRVAAIAW